MWHTCSRTIAPAALAANEPLVPAPFIIGTDESNGLVVPCLEIVRNETCGFACIAIVGYGAAPGFDRLPRLLLNPSISHECIIAWYRDGGRGLANGCLLRYTCSTLYHIHIMRRELNSTYLYRETREAKSKKLPTREFCHF